jgi:alpha-tubulin suppressor-like RCC1 family protein
LVVKVLSADGNPVAGQLVNFRVIAGGGSMFAGSSITNKDGISQDRWTLGPVTADSQVAEARAVDNTTGNPIVFARFRANIASAPALDVAAAEFHTCAVNQANRASCWGMNPYGPIGDGTTIDRYVPTPVIGGIKFTAVAALARFSCAIAIDAAPYCWGDNDQGEVGDGTTAGRRAPTPVIGGLHLRAITAGAYAHTCGLTVDSTAFCWGINFGSSPVNLGTTRFAAISSGGNHSCAITAAGAAYCWGINSNGEFGNGTTNSTFSAAFTPVSGGLQFQRISAGSGHTCALTTAGKAYCWGYNFKGEVGDGGGSNRTSPTPVSTALSFEEITTGWYTSCGLIAGGAAYCWGDNEYGQLGDGTASDRSTPVAVVGGHSFRKISGGGHHTCAIETGTTANLYCWGENRFGELGDGTQADHNVPTLVKALP